VYKYLKSSIDHGVFDNNITGKADANVTSEDHKVISQRLAEEGIVLLKNEESALPLRKPSLGTNNILVIGNAAYHGLTHFNGTSMAQNDKVAQPFDLLCERLRLPKLSD